jgi:hypothetical protein
MRLTPTDRTVVAVAGLVLAVVAIAVLVQAATAPVLVVTVDHTGEEIVATPVEEGSTVTLDYMHSVEKTTVKDIYVVEGDHFRMKQMEFSSYGWGLPARAEIDGHTEDGDFLLTFENRTYQRLDVVPGRVANHTLIVDGRRYDLVEPSNARAVTITIERGRPLVQFRKYV